MHQPDWDMRAAYRGWLCLGRRTWPAERSSLSGHAGAPPLCQPALLPELFPAPEATVSRQVGGSHYTPGNKTDSSTEQKPLQLCVA